MTPDQEKYISEHGIAHHGPPIMLPRDVKLCEAMAIWINTVRASKRYQADWLPSQVDIIKSRLFWRIRSGKEPLPEPPPCCWSCPWYEVVEALEPHDIFDVHPYPKEWSNGKDLISVGQTPYEVKERREDGSMVVGFGGWRFRLWRDEAKWREGHKELLERLPDYKIKPEDAWWIERQPTLEVVSGEHKT